MELESKNQAIFCEEKRIEQVLLNFVKNSDFVPKNGGKISLRIEDEIKNKGNSKELKEHEINIENKDENQKGMIFTLR